MSPILRNVLAIVAGVVVGLVVITSVQFVNNVIFPPPPGIDLSDPAAMKAAVGSLPAGAFIVLILGYLVGTTAGCWTAGRIAAEGQRRVMRLVALVFVVGGILNFRSIPHPTWVVVASFLAFGVSPTLATLLTGKPLRT